MIVAGGANPDTATYTVTFRPGAGTFTELGLQVVQDEALPGVRVARGADRLVVSEIEAEIAGQKIPFSLARSSCFSPLDIAPNIRATAAIDGDLKTGWGIATYGDNRDLFLSLRFAKPVRTEADTVMTVRLHQDSGVRRATIGRFRIALNTGAYTWMGPLDKTEKKTEEETEATLMQGLAPHFVKALETKPDERTDEQRKETHEYLMWMTPELAPQFAAVAKIEAELGELHGAIPRGAGRYAGCRASRNSHDSAAAVIF